MKMPRTEDEVNEKIYDHRIMPDWSNVVNETNGTMHYSKDMIFNDGHRLSITVYSILFVLSSIGNSTVLYLIVKRRWHNRTRSPSRIDIMLMHLAIADLMVTFLLMPLEIAWAYTVQWRSTDFVCRLMSFFRVFGLYLSSFVLVSISIDRYYAILKPLKFSTSRGRIMLAIAWVASVICSTPQAFVFHLEQHPKVTGYYQCVTFHSFPTELQKMIYQISTMCAMYTFPLITFIYCYGRIYLEIYSKSKRMVKGDDKNGFARFRRSNDDVLGRAKKRTLKMTITIVIVFVICWTPYYIICMWFWIDKHSAYNVNPLLRKILFIFACTNSCMNPLVYGVFNIRGKTNNNTSVNNRHTSLSSGGRMAMKERNGSSRTIVTIPAVINGSSGDTSNATQSTNISNDIFTISKITEDMETEKPPKICISDPIDLANTTKTQQVT
ncbi:PREDICTED: gonadotropin-releasing hormone receptor-like isoform X1 [Rhagoletis zephyria]|uniref:gonadotropin-releasing hormone receptor-like isoform X1 n=1 Tax=Rhagoletis zephyria TaxID=28612 RepID=UPI00081179CE|nr:PREDICTED: gonadotropin-releasing hormone receptor-like isoform X1 [Rhagoletis zephyria]XP_017473992.1 PREDICTED: gonadotropin-releasing hormone receptor-like isoform X1 [Rhagoletis zephyria]XP_017474001.1 PREDICTED: gonadotropin-releasing hormone receptor-like isoform X1 [Rhagoletis zephyria]XP_017474008.1 PREDICTED: gonadotropin-releasing hormone receptor-like isoform X1 [Rhagoletis zephyria]XP_017474014.1 PREDICTED: gonadotropin-releasing hormone receptor-like isoform X1 [Rhagoletis zephy